jgi:hypothetical protein
MDGKERNKPSEAVRLSQKAHRARRGAGYWEGARQRRASARIARESPLTSCRCRTDQARSGSGRPS